MHKFIAIQNKFVVFIFSVVPVQAFPAVTTEKERSQSRQNLSSTFETWTPGGVGKDVLFILDKLRAKQQLP